MENLRINQRFITDKTPELALYYNLAIDQLNDLISSYERNKFILDNSLQNLKSNPKKLYLKPETYLHLSIYLWKYSLKENTPQLSEEQIEIINLTLIKLIELRNFQSHYYHDDAELQFPSVLINHIHTLFLLAQNTLVVKNPSFKTWIPKLEEYIVNKKGKNDSYRHFDFFDEKGFILPEGKNFFLSFFLLKSQMAHFLKKRNRCKIEKGQIYQVKASIYSFYCHRDNSSRFFLTHNEIYSDEFEPLRRQFNFILDYLRSKPVVKNEYLPQPKEIYLFSKKEIQEFKKKRAEKTTDWNPIAIRTSNKFMQIAINYIMDRKRLRCNDTLEVFWEVISPSYNNLKSEDSKDEKNYKSYLAIDKSWSSAMLENYRPYIFNNHVRFKIPGVNNIFVINESELRNWLILLLTGEVENNDIIINLLITYGNQFCQALDELVNSQGISFNKYPKVFGDDGQNRSVLSEMYLDLLEMKPFNELDYRLKIERKLQMAITRNNEFLNNKNKFGPYKKNNIILTALNWYLPQDSKLTQRQVANLSMHNHLLKNKVDTKISESLMRPVVDKLSRVPFDIRECFFVSESLDDLYVEIVSLKLRTLSDELKKINEKSLDQLHILARNLCVRMHGVTNSRNPVSSRIEELKKTIKNKPIFIRNGFFKSQFKNNSSSFSDQIIRNKSWQDLLITAYYDLSNQTQFIQDIPEDILFLVEKNYKNCFEEYKKNTDQKFIDLINLFEKGYSGEVYPTIKKDIGKAINLFKLLKEIQIKDSLLTQILFKYLSALLPEGKKEYCNIKDLNVFKYILTAGEKRIELQYKQLDDLAITWNRKKIRNLITNKHYWNEDLFENKNQKSDQQKIYYAKNNVLKESLQYIKEFLNIEKKVIQNSSFQLLRSLIEKSRIIKTTGLERIDPKIILEAINVDSMLCNELIQFRNDAFHTNIPSGSYDTLTKLLSELNVKQHMGE